MKKSCLKVCCMLLTMALCSSVVMAHQGKTDEYGGHYDTKTGEYHYHLHQESCTHYNNLDFFKEDITQVYHKELKKLGYTNYQNIGILHIVYSENKEDECINKGKIKIRCVQKNKVIVPKIVVENPIQIDNPKEDRYIIVYEYNKDDGIITLYSNENDELIGEIMP